jgi:hypothetical protein
MDINIAELRKRYGASSKHYQAILSGSLHAMHHVHHYKGVLKAPDGTKLTCEYMSSVDDGETLGTCDDGKGQIYEVHK